MRQLLQWMIRLVHLLVIWIDLVSSWLFLFDLVCSQNTDPYQHLGFHNLHHFDCLQFGNAKNYLLTKLLTKIQQGGSFADPFLDLVVFPWDSFGTNLKTR